MIASSDTEAVYLVKREIYSDGTYYALRTNVDGKRKHALDLKVVTRPGRAGVPAAPEPRAQARGGAA